MTYEDQAVGAYVLAAKPFLEYIRPRNSCITQARITIEVMRRLGVSARPVSTSLMVTCPEVKTCYISGFSKAERDDMRGQAANWIDTTTDDDSAGWRGHICTVVAGRWFVDTSLDQASSPSHGMIIEPNVFSIKLPKKYKDGVTQMELTAATEGGLKLDIHYYPNRDRSFVKSEAWELCPHVVRLIDLIHRAVGLVLR